MSADPSAVSSIVAISAMMSAMPWKGQAAARDAVYANRRRIRGARGKRLLRQRGELLERPNAHLYETGRMRRVHSDSNIRPQPSGQAAVFGRRHGYGFAFSHRSSSPW